MLTTLQLSQRRRRRSPPSLKEQYHRYVLQRIEEYKNQLSRAELLRIGDEAVAEMEAADAGQFVLTEMMMVDWVDKLIHRRLRLPAFKRWSQRFKALRAAQREPTHWGIDPASPVTRLLPRLEPGDRALAVGAASEPILFLLAAHDIASTFVAADLAFVDRVEARVAGEVLSDHCMTYVARPPHWPFDEPDSFHVVVLDAGALAGLDAAAQELAIQALQQRTVAGGVHLLLPGGPTLAPEALLSTYADWSRDEMEAGRRRSKRSLGVLLTKDLNCAEPERQRLAD